MAVLASAVSECASAAAAAAAHRVVYTVDLTVVAEWVVAAWAAEVAVLRLDEAAAVAAVTVCFLAFQLRARVQPVPLPVVSNVAVQAASAIGVVIARVCLTCRRPQPHWS